MQKEVELLLVVLLDPVNIAIDHKVLAVGLLEILVESEALHLVTALLGNIVEHLLGVLVRVSVCLTHTRFVGLLGALIQSDVDVALKDGALDVLDAKDKLHQVWDDFSWACNQIFISYDMDWDILFHPSIMEVTPDRNFCFDPLFPLLLVADEIRVQD